MTRGSFGTSGSESVRDIARRTPGGNAGVLGLVIAALVLAARWVGQGGGLRSDRTLEILRERYARGQINKDEFEARQRDLR